MRGSDETPPELASLAPPKALSVPWGGPAALIDPMFNRVRQFFNTWLLLELAKGLALTGRYMFSRKFTIQFPEEKTPKSPRFRGLHALREHPSTQIPPVPSPACTRLHR